LLGIYSNVGDFLRASPVSPPLAEAAAAAADELLAAADAEAAAERAAAEAAQQAEPLVEAVEAVAVAMASFTEADDEPAVGQEKKETAEAALAPVEEKEEQVEHAPATLITERLSNEALPLSALAELAPGNSRASSNGAVLSKPVALSGAVAEVCLLGWLGCVLCAVQTQLLLRRASLHLQSAVA
jgi:multidrug efflux pump subunit AcrA (membrane-fusion protein)